MNEAIRPAPESAQQAVGLPVLSVVVPTFNERDNVAKLYRKLDATLAELRAWLQNERGVRVGITALWREIKRLGLTLKKSRSMPRNRTARTWRQPA